MSKQNVKSYFDVASENYQNKNYGESDKFLQYFFTQRLKKCVQGLDFEKRKILDIGAGTGALYNFLSENNNKLEYYATDISDGMLSKSRIPINQRFIGDAYNNTFNFEKVDYIYMLGVVTYIPEQELEKIFAYINNISHPETKLILTINHDKTIHRYAHNLLKPIMKLIALKDKVVSQKINIQYYEPNYFYSILQKYGFEIDRVDSLNQSIYPFNRLFPNIFCKLGNYLDSNLKEGKLKRFISSDLALRFNRIQL